jgi:hypothetical protein
LTRVPSRSKPDYARARRWRWGDVVMGEQPPGHPGERRDP